MEQILIWVELSHGISTGSQVSWAASKRWAPQGTVELPPTEIRRGRFRQEQKQTRVADINRVCQVVTLAWEMSEIDSQSAKKAHFPFLIYLCKHFSSVHAKKEKISLKICLSESHISSAPSTWLCFVLCPAPQTRVKSELHLFPLRIKQKQLYPSIHSGCLGASGQVGLALVREGWC